MVCREHGDGIALRYISRGGGVCFHDRSACRNSRDLHRQQTPLGLMDPYAKPKERKTGAQRPKIRHLPQFVEPRTRRERQAEKQAVAEERRAIKKAARRHLKEQLL